MRRGLRRLLWFLGLYLAGLLVFAAVVFAFRALL
jgi:hypothetical protein